MGEMAVCRPVPLPANGIWGVVEVVIGVDCISGSDDEIRSTRGLSKLFESVNLHDSSI